MTFFFLFPDTLNQVGEFHAFNYSKLRKFKQFSLLSFFFFFTFLSFFLSWRIQDTSYIVFGESGGLNSNILFRN